MLIGGRWGLSSYLFKILLTLLVYFGFLFFHDVLAMVFINIRPSLWLYHTGFDCGLFVAVSILWTCFCVNWHCSIKRGTNSDAFSGKGKRNPFSVSCSMRQQHTSGKPDLPHAIQLDKCLYAVWSRIYPLGFLIVLSCGKDITCSLCGGTSFFVRWLMGEH